MLVIHYIHRESFVSAWWLWWHFNLSSASRWPVRSGCKKNTQVAKKTWLLKLPRLLCVYIDGMRVYMCVYSKISTSEIFVIWPMYPFMWMFAELWFWVLSYFTQLSNSGVCGFASLFSINGVLSEEHVDLVIFRVITLWNEMDAYEPWFCTHSESCITLNRFKTTVIASLRFC